jgi:hypothetical protein
MKLHDLAKRDWLLFTKQECVEFKNNNSDLE